MHILNLWRKYKISKLTHVIAVFKAEYFTTTSRFRKYRSWIPLLFVSGVLMFGYILRSLFDLVRGDLIITQPPISVFYSILALFSYFTLFAPLLSARVIYDDGAKSRREVAMNTPVSGKDLLTGNMLSNLSFYLPFFGMIGTLILLPFIGNGAYNALTTSLMIFAVLALLIVIGLVSGSLISPVIFYLISNQKNEVSRALVTLLVSTMMITSLPLLRYLMDNVDETSSDIGLMKFLPFTIAASLMLFILYGDIVGTNPLIGLIIMLTYIVIIVIVGWWRADRLYGLNSDTGRGIIANPESRNNRVLNYVTLVIPKRYRPLSRLMMKASLRDVEHISRLSIGIAVTVFMIFAMSSRGLFRTSQNFTEDIELAVVIFSLVLSSASVIFIEASSFTLQHRDMLSMVKSAPQGPQKLIISKAIQMFYFTIPIFLTLIVFLARVGFISDQNQLPLIFVMIITLGTLICVSLMIYLVSPVDNQEDLTNFINLLFFYIFSFTLAILPVIAVIKYSTIPFWYSVMYLLICVIISILSIHTAIKSLDDMNIETLSSKFSSKLIQIIKSIMIFILVWNFFPLFAIQYFIISNNIIGFLILSSLLTLIIPVFMWLTHSIKRPNFKIKISDLRVIGIGFVMMILFALFFSVIAIIFYPASMSSFSIITSELNFSLPILLTLVIITVIAEELIFRGFLFDYNSEFLDQKEMIIITSIFFGLIHFLSVISFLNAIVQGIILGWTRAKTNSTGIPIVLHLIYNLTILSLFF